VIDLRLLTQQYEALTFQDRGLTDFWFDAGVGTGKTYVASRWVYRQIREQPRHVVGFIGANEYDQLNQAVLPPLLEFLDERGIDWVIHKSPPTSWNVRSPFPRHKNILTLRTGHQFICKCLREKRFHIAGVQIGYWWIDEIGDVPEEAFQKIRERRRQPGANLLGLVTGTPGGPAHFTFRHYMNPGTRLPNHSYAKARTLDGVKAGWLPMRYYEELKATMSKRRALARLEGEVVDSEQLRAYESHDSKINCTRLNRLNGNKAGLNPNIPIGIFCDFNPVKVCIWELGQFDFTHTHVFDEVALETTRVEVMLKEVLRRYGNWPSGFHIFGDASGTRDEMSSGMACYDTIKQILSSRRIRHTVTVPRANPHVSDRIEAVNASLCAYDGSVKFTYDDQKCKHLHLDFLRVGWDGVRLQDGGDPDRTHASDGVGYHIVAIRPVRGPSYVPLAGHGGYR
jgi:hypothetical protein